MNGDMPARAWDRECRRNRPEIIAALELGIDGHGPAPMSTFAAGLGPGAMDHLERCGWCRAEAGETALTLIRIERWVDEASLADPSPDAWQRLRSRIEASTLRAREAAWRARANVAGLVTGTLLVAVAVGPMAVSGAADGWSFGRASLGSAPAELPARERFLGPIELRYVRESQQAPAWSPPTTDIGVPSGPRMLPDGIKPGAKEVSPSQSTGRPRDVS